MPFVSLSQEGWAHEHPDKFGRKNLKEFDAATKGEHLPEHKHMTTHSNYDHMDREGDHSAIQQVVKEHGLAHSHHHYSGDGATHTVVTHHADGHTHESKGHPHMDHAVEHIKEAHTESY
jgi:hypothetical protein